MTIVNIRDIERTLRRTPLVQSRITQTDYFFSFYVQDLRIRPFKTAMTKIPDNVRSEITGFSRASQRRLSFIARNSAHHLTSQFCMTYHQTTPDGITAKKHLNIFLTMLRKYFKDFKYLWIMEFQKRGTVHFHLFTNLPVNKSIHQRLAQAWNTITGESEEHLKFHQYTRNYIQWDMGKGSYVTKYLQKMEQKGVPESFKNCGRFWGNSKNIVPQPYNVTMEEILATVENKDQIEYIAKFIRRTICKCYEKTLSKKKNKNVNYRKRGKSLLIPFGKKLLYQLLDYIAIHLLPFKFT